MPNSLAFIFISPTKFAKPPGKVRPSACAARFSLDISARCSNSPRLRTVPTVRRERLPFSVSTSSWLMVMSSSMGSRASEISTPVISLVMEAMGNTASSFLWSKTGYRTKGGAGRHSGGGFGLALGARRRACAFGAVGAQTAAGGILHRKAGAGPNHCTQKYQAANTFLHQCVPNLNAA